MAKDQFGNYVANQTSASEDLTSEFATGTQQVFGSEDGDVVDGVPQVTPTTETAIYIGTDGTQYQWFGGAWH